MYYVLNLCIKLRYIYLHIYYIYSFRAGVIYDAFYGKLWLKQ